MVQSHHKGTEKCDLNYDFLYAGIILGAIQVSACIFVGLFSNRMNKKLFLAVSTFMSAGLCFLTIFLTSEYMIIVSLATMVIILYVSFPILVSIVVELFPTQLRSSATSITMTCARLGSAVGSQVMGVLYENHCEAGYFGLTSILVGSGFYTFYVGLTSGLTGFSAIICLLAMSFVMPVAGCELHLSNATRGILSSMSFTGMLFSAQFFGFLADTFGRKRVMIYSQLATLIVVVLWSLAPDSTTLAVILFVNGLILTGSLTPIFVFAGEFCSSQIRSKMLVCMYSLAAMANAYLPGMAWIILPIDINIPITENFVFTSWRLYILLLTVPVFLSTLLLLKLPETPKFLLNQGRQEETLEILKSMYAVNQRKSRDEFPISSVCLDLEDQTSLKGAEGGNMFINYFQMMFKQIAVLFSKKYVIFTFISCILLFSENGMCNTLTLWFPEQTSRIRHYSQSHETFNVTLCYLMKKNNHQNIMNCKLDYDYLAPSIILGSIEVISCLVVGLFANKINKKLVLAGNSFLTAGLCFLTMFLTSEYIIIASLAVMTILMFVAFPMLVSIVVELFPTQLRSTATSITMTSGRMGSAVGSQVMGVLYENHCKTGYLGLSSLLVACGILCILIPIQRKSP